jgi:hypothetical protein
VTRLATGEPADPSWRVTLHFHPDRLTAGTPILERLARDGVYRSQFETGTSNGGLTAHPGGSPRFGSAHLRLAAHTLSRTTFCYPDSFHEPENFGAAPRLSTLIALAQKDDQDRSTTTSKPTCTASSTSPATSKPWSSTPATATHRSRPRPESWPARSNGTAVSP